jgi:hypothetical protein
MSFLDHFRSKPASHSAVAERLAELVMKRLTAHGTRGLVRCNRMLGGGDAADARFTKDPI